MGRFANVVFLDDREVGVVCNAKDIEHFVSDLVERCGELYGMEMNPVEDIVVIKEYRPDSKPETEAVRAFIRQHMTLLTDAYMITVDGTPLIPVDSKEVLDEVVGSLKAIYKRSDEGIETLECYILEELSVISCRVPPDKILTAEEVVELLSVKCKEQILQTAFIPFSKPRGAFENRQTYSHGEPDLSEPSLLEAKHEGRPGKDEDLNAAVIHVQTVEKVTVKEKIPFEVEYEYDDEMWVVQSETTVTGREGIRKIVYHVTRKNDVEIKRTKVDERVIEPPVTQVETHGTAQVPSVGTGRFIWPVDGGGEVTPGRGFSSWHTGIDIMADTGTNVLAADSGIAWFSGYGGSQGNYIILYHGSYWTLYLHNTENLVNKGEKVEQGDVIARVGSTGRSTGPHLHFEIRIDDGTGEWHTYYQHKPVDPLRYFRP